MTDKIVIEMCLWCRLSFNVKELHPVEIYNSPIEFYICDICLKDNPLVKIPAPFEL